MSMRKKGRRWPATHIAALAVWLAALAVMLAAMLGGCAPSVEDQTNLQCPLAACGGQGTSGGGSTGGGGGSTGGGVYPLASVLPHARFVVAANTAGNTVSSFTMDSASGLLRATGYALAGTAPTAIVVDPTGQFVYTANHGSNDVSGYTFAPGWGGLVAIAGTPVPTGGTGPTGLAADPFGRFLFVVDGSSRDLAAYAISSATGALAPLSLSPYAMAPTSSPQPPVVTPDGRFVYVPDSGGNTIAGWAIDGATPALTPVRGSPFPVSGNPGGSYAAVDPAGKHLYVLSPTTGDVSAYAINADTGALTEVAGSPFAAGATAATALAVHPGGDTLYEVGGFGMLGQAIQADGSLAGGPGGPFTVGNQPMGIAMDPAGRYAYLANNGDGEVAVVSIASGTGVPTLVAPYRVQQGVHGVALAGGAAALTFVPKVVLVVNQAVGSQLSSFLIDPSTGNLTAGVTASDPGAIFPFSAAIHPNGKFAYVANLNSFNVSGYTVNPTTGALSLIPTSPYSPGGNTLTSVAVDPSGRFAYAVDSTNNAVYLFTVNQATGALTFVSSLGTGSSPNWVAVDPTGQFVYTGNSVSNNVSEFSIAPSTGTLTSIGTSAAVGNSVHALTVDGSGRFLYLGSQNTTLQEFSINAATGSLTPLGSVAGSGGEYGIAADPTGQSVYTASFTTHLAASYQVGGTGSLNLLSSVGPLGTTPSGMAVDITNHYLYETDQGANQVLVYVVNPGGTLTQTASYGSGGSGQPYMAVTWGTFQ